MVQYCYKLSLQYTLKQKLLFQWKPTILLIILQQNCRLSKPSVLSPGRSLHRPEASSGNKSHSDIQKSFSKRDRKACFEVIVWLKLVDIFLTCELFSLVLISSHRTRDTQWVIAKAGWGPGHWFRFCHFSVFHPRQVQSLQLHSPPGLPLWSLLAI